MTAPTQAEVLAALDNRIEQCERSPFAAVENEAIALRHARALIAAMGDEARQRERFVHWWDTEGDRGKFMPLGVWLAATAWEE